ncbi:YlcI/YnfO family protein [Serratia ureilytica]|uniref:YlcI/YnfO family protein n=1 Tax=Serratia ureilytica TaxID=300181 RepID=UPI00313BF2C2
MATKAVNAKSQTVAARVPHGIMDAVEAVKAPGESTGQFVTSALKREVEFRLLSKTKESPEG